MNGAQKESATAGTNGTYPSNVEHLNHNELLEAALAYAARGWAVFPVHETGDCKTPRTPHGFKDATTDSAAIRRWWQRWPNANIGIATGASGLLVLDVDDGGEDSLTDYPTLPDTIESLTGGGGSHILFKRPTGDKFKSCTGIAPGLDVRADGGYIIPPPSIHKSGNRYEWEASSEPDDVPLANSPDWLIEAVRVAPTPAANGANWIPPGLPNNTEVMLAAIPADDRDDWLKVGMALHHADPVRGRGSWDRWSQTSDKYDGKDQARVWASFGRGDCELVTVASLWRLAMAHGWQPPNQNSEPELWQQPEPLRREPPPPEPFPMDALGDVLGGAAGVLSRIIQSPDAVIGQSLLAAAALAVQAHADITIDGRRSPLSLFFLTVAETGERKSATDNAVLAPVKKREHDLIVEKDAERPGYEADLAAYKKSRDAVLKDTKKDRAETRAALEALGPEPAPPIMPILLSGDPTLEGLLKALIGGWPSMGLFSSEGGRFFGGYAMNKDNALKTAAGLSELWDGGAVERTRSIDGASKHYGKRASLHLMAQPGVASTLLSDAMMRDQGLLSRMLVAWPQGKTGQREYVAENVQVAPEMKRYFGRLMAWLERDLPIDEDKRNELVPRELLLDESAHADFVAFYRYVESLMAEGRALESVRGLANKAPELAARMAGVLTLIGDASADRITAEHMAAGIRLMRYYLTEALRVHEVAADCPDLRLAERCLAWIRAQGHRTSLVDLYQRGPNPVRDKTTASRIIGVLESHGWARTIGPGEINGVRRRELWEVQP